MAPVVEETTFVSARVPRDLADEFAKIAEAADRSVSAELRRVMKAHVDAARTKSDGEAA